MYYNLVCACKFCMSTCVVGWIYPTNDMFHALYLALQTYFIVHVQLHSHELVWITMSANRCTHSTVYLRNDWGTLDMPTTCWTLCNLDGFRMTFHDISLTMSGASIPESGWDTLHLPWIDESKWLVSRNQRHNLYINQYAIQKFSRLSLDASNHVNMVANRYHKIWF